MRFLAAILTLCVAACGGSGGSYEYTSAPVYNVSYGAVEPPNEGYIWKGRDGYTIIIEPSPFDTLLLVHEFLHGLVDGPVLDHPEPGTFNFISVGEWAITDLELYHGPQDQWILENASPRTIIVANQGNLRQRVVEAAAWINMRAGREVLTVVE